MIASINHPIKICRKILDKVVNNRMTGQQKLMHQGVSGLCSNMGSELFFTQL